jgi:hypothetical protein
MPPDQGVRFHNRENAAPLDQPRQDDEHDPRGIVGTPWLRLALHVQRELLPKEQILSGESGV